MIAAVLGALAASGQPASIDHVLLGVSDLDAAVRDFERKTGVKPQYGGSHPGAGTRNALVSLGRGTYLELIAPDPAQDTSKGFAAVLRAFKRPTPVGWAIRTSDAAALRSRLGKAGYKPGGIDPGSRKRPDGVRLSWATFELDGLDESVEPFFIQWRTAQHPSLPAPPGCRLVALHVRTPQAGPIIRLKRTLGLVVDVKQAAKSSLSLDLNCPKGRVSYRN